MPATSRATGVLGAMGRLRTMVCRKQVAFVKGSLNCEGFLERMMQQRTICFTELHRNLQNTDA